MKNTKRFAGGVSLALALGLSGALLQPATFASAMTVDCRYTKGMGEYVYDHPELGLSCAGGPGGVGGTSTGTTHWGAPGRVLNAGASGNPSGGFSTTPCTWAPDALYSLPGTITYKDYATRGTMRSAPGYDRVYYRDGKEVARASGEDYAVYYIDYTFRDFGLMIYGTAWCSAGASGSWEMSYTSSPNLGSPVPPPVIPAPGTIPFEVTPTTETTTSMAQIPAKTNEYVFRAKITNTGTYSTPVNFGLDLESFKLTGDLGLPRDTSCLTTAALWAECTIPNLEAGETQNITLLMKTRPTWHTTATLPTITSGIGKAIGIPNARGLITRTPRYIPVAEQESVEVEVTPSFPKP